MNWTTEIPKESGWYWARTGSYVEVLYLAPDLKTIWAVGSTRKVSDYFFWGDKLEIPE